LERLSKNTVYPKRLFSLVSNELNYMCIPEEAPGHLGAQVYGFLIQSQTKILWGTEVAILLLPEIFFFFSLLLHLLSLKKEVSDRIGRVNRTDFFRQCSSM
jgi:hypothetical protein